MIQKFNTHFLNGPLWGESLFCSNYIFFMDKKDVIAMILIFIYMLPGAAATEKWFIAL